jgi:hypothetical protein
MVPGTRGSSKTTIFMEKVLTNGQMVENSQETGSSTRCMAMGCLNGLMADVTKVNMWMIKSKDMARSNGNYFFN